MSVGLGSLMPVFQYRVVVDEVLVPNPAAAEMPSFYLTEALHAVAELFAVSPLTSAVLIFIAMFVVQSVVGLAQQLLLTSGALKTLRDLRIDLFASLERKPASFYDHVAVGRVMTRVTNDTLHELQFLDSQTAAEMLRSSSAETDDKPRWTEPEDDGFSQEPMDRSGF